MILCSKLKNGLWKIVTKSQVVTKSRLHCTHVMVTKAVKFSLDGYTIRFLKLRRALKNRDVMFEFIASRKIKKFSSIKSRPDLAVKAYL